MDEDFDLYGDADIYGATEVKEDEEQQKRTQEQLSGKSSGAAQDSATASNPAHTNRAPDNATAAQPHQQGYQPAQSQSGYNAGSTSSGHYQPAQVQQVPPPSYPVHNGDPSEPSAARVGLAGRPKVVDPNVQNALYVGELDWWVSDEEIRRIANDIGIPIRLNDVTFSEHKVNGKSKGLAFVETADEDEARRLKAWFESNDVNHKRATVTLATSASGNPFKTLPKDPPPRENRPMRGGGRGGMAMGAREGGGRRDGGNMPAMAGAPMRMGGGNNGQGGNMAAAMMNPMMMGMMGGGGRGGFGRGGGRPPMNMGMGHFNPNFFGGGGGGRGGYNGQGGDRGYNNNSGAGGDDRERKRYRSDDNY